MLCAILAAWMAMPVCVSIQHCINVMHVTVHATAGISFIINLSSLISVFIISLKCDYLFCSHICSYTLHFVLWHNDISLIVLILCWVVRSHTCSRHIKNETTDCGADCCFLESAFRSLEFLNTAMLSGTKSPKKPIFGPHNNPNDR